MGVPGKLQRDARFFGNGHAARHVGEQDARPVTVQSCVLQYGPGMARVVIVHANDLQAIHINFFVVQDMDARLLHCLQMLRMAGESIMIAGYEICAQGNRKIRPGFGQPV